MQGRRLVEGAVEGYFHRPGELNERPRTIDVHGVVLKKDTEDNARRSESLRVFDLVAHRFDFGAGVKKISSPRTDEYVQRERGDFNCCAN